MELNQRRSVVAAGVDAARGGWVVATASGGGEGLALALEPTLDGVLARAGDGPVAIDMPIGLLDRVEPRACDRAARALLGARAATVFTPPSRPALAAATYAQARTTVTGAASLSAQAFGLAPRIRELDALAAFAVPRRAAAPADALDACAVLVTALRIAGGEEVTTLGGERDARGLPMRIVV